MSKYLTYLFLSSQLFDVGTIVILMERWEDQDEQRSSAIRTPG